MGLLSWLRGDDRRTRADSDPGTGAVTGAGAQVSDAPADRRDRSDRVDLRELAPVQRTLGDQDLLIDPTGFQGGLTTRQDTALGRPLGHLVSPEAPGGLVHGVSVPGPPVAPTAQRAVEMPLRAGAVSRTAPVPVQRSSGGHAAYGDGTPAMTSAGPSTVSELPVRHLVGEQPVGEAAPDVMSAESAREPERPLLSGTVQRSVAAPEGNPLPGGPRRTPGLGAPLSALPPTAQRQAAASLPGTDRPGGAEGPAGEVPVREGADAGDEPSEAAVPFASESVPAEPTAPLLGEDPLVSRPAPPVPPREAGDGTDGGAQALRDPVQRTTSAPGSEQFSLSPLSPPTGPVAPLLGDRPLPLHAVEGAEAGRESTAAVQRSATAAGAAARTGAPSAAPVPPTVPVRWTHGDPESTGAAVQRTVVPAADALPSRPPGPVPAASSSTSRASLAAVQRSTGAGGPPVPRSLAGTGGQRASSGPAHGLADAGSYPVAAGVAQRLSDGSVVFGSPSPPGRSRPVVQREEETSEPPPPEPDQVPEPEPEPVDDAGGDVGSDAGGAGPTGSAASVQTHQEGQGQAGAPPVTDELVRALYPPLSRLFRADLRQERERAGFLIDTRH